MAYTATQKRWREADNIAAIWRDARDTLPFDDPYNHLDRLLFHSSLDYIKVIGQRSFNLNLPARSNFKDTAHKYPLYQHGRGAFPFILGNVVVAGQVCAFAGSVPVQLNVMSGAHRRGFARWLTLGADATWVYINEYCANYWSNSDFYGTYPAINVPITVWMTNEILEGAGAGSPPTTGTQFHLGDYFSIGNGKFDSRNRYIRKVANAADKTLNMCLGQSLAVNTTTGGEASWRWQCNSASVVSDTPITVPAAGFNVGINAAI